MNGYASSPRVGFDSHGVANGGVPNGYGSHVPRQGGNTGFVLNRRKERIDWRKIASVNIDHLTRTLDVEVLRENISSIAYCDIEEEVDTRVVDQNFLKVFKMSQLIIQYLVHTQDYFTETVQSLKEEASTFHQREEERRKEVEVISEQLFKVKQESHKRKKLLKAQQNLIQSGVNNYHQCAYCPKAFTQAAFLQSHLLRKHPEYVSQGAHPHESQTEMKKMDEMREKLEHEMEELKDRLKVTQSQLVEERGRLEEQLERQKQEQEEKAELTAQEEAMRSEFVEWKKEQSENHKAEMEKMQSMFLKEMKEMHDNHSVSQAALEDLQSKLGKRSNLGTLVDEDEIAEQRKLIKKQHSEMKQMKEEYEEKLQEARASLEDDRNELEKRWEVKMKDQKKRYSKDTKELRALLENMATTLKEEKKGGSDSERRHRKEIQNVLKKSKEYEAQLKERERELQEVKQVKQTKQKTEETKPPPSPTPPRIRSPTPETSEESEEELVESEELTKQKMVEAMRRQIDKTLQLKLEQKGIPQGVQGISNQALDVKTRQMKQDRQSLAKKHTKLYDIREQLRKDIEQQTRGRKKGDGRGQKGQVRSGTASLQYSKPANQSSTGTFPRSQTLPRSILAKPKEQPKRPAKRSNSLPGSSARRKTPPPVAPRDQGRGSPSVVRSASSGSGRRPGTEVRTPVQRSQPSTSTPKNQNQARVSVPRVSFEDDLSDNESDDDEDDEDEDLSLEDEEESEVTDTPVAKPHPHQRQAAPVTIPRADPVPNGKAQGYDAEDSDWDSEDISALDEVSAGKMQRGGGRPSSSTPKGPMVSELSKSIEAQLQGRHSTKKPVGGIDLSGTGRNGALSPDPRTASPSPRIPTIPDAGEESDDSLAISSLDGSISSPPKQQTRSQPAGSNRPHPGQPTSDASNTYGTSVWGTSSNKANSAHGSTKGTNKTSTVSVTDFDDDDDLDLSDF